MFRELRVIRGFGRWAAVPQNPPDPILGLAATFNSDPNTKKVNLIVGAYRDNEGKPWILDSIRKARETLSQKPLGLEYLPMGGDASYVNAMVKLALGEGSTFVQDKRVAAIQTLSGTGALSIGFQFILHHMKQRPTIYTSNPTWPVHNTLAKYLGFEVVNYRYYDPKSKGLDWAGMEEDLKKAPEGSVILLHPSAHNPTGVDLSSDNWKSVRDIIVSRNLLAFFDMAYQGFASGDLEKDALPVRMFARENIPFILGQSCAKNFGVYGTRTGALSVVTENSQETERVQSQLVHLARINYSNPPLEGARLVGTVLNTPELYKVWEQDIKTMSGRIIEMRKQLVSELKNCGSTLDWSHITNQIGMFAFTGLTKEQTLEIRKKYAIYFTDNGRISVAGLNTSNVRLVAQAFDAVTKH